MEETKEIIVDVTKAETVITEQPKPDLPPVTILKEPMINYGVELFSGGEFNRRMSAMFAVKHMRHYVCESWSSTTEPALLLKLDSVKQTYVDMDEKDYQVWIDDGVMCGFIKMQGATICPNLISNDRQHMLNYIRELQDKFKKFENVPVEDTNVYLHFWSGPQGQHGASIRTRVIDAPTWGDIEQNYTEPVNKDLNFLMGYRPTEINGGKLILWQGVPGTGKTTAIRALARSWRDWCSFEYVLDPEVLFGGGAAYLTEVMTHGGADTASPIKRKRAEVDQRWRLLILEDAGELISEDAKAKTGQGLSKLLNMADGLIGQGVRLMIMITTNEDIGNLAPSVRRPGRCLQSVQFDKLSKVECRAWYERHKKPEIAAAVSGPMPLADLYAGLVKPTEKTDKRMGF